MALPRFYLIETTIVRRELFDGKVLRPSKTIGECEDRGDAEQLVEILNVFPDLVALAREGLDRRREHFGLLVAIKDVSTFPGPERAAQRAIDEGARALAKAEENKL